jgi:hypothetical protein
MRTLFPAIILTLASHGVIAQGTVNFANASSARVMGGPSCPLPAGTTFKAALYYLPDGPTPPTSVDFDAYRVVLEPSVGFAFPGIFIGGTRSTPSSGGTAAWFQVRVWETAFGATYEQAVNNPIAIGGRLALVGTSNIIRVTTGDPTTTPPTIPGSLMAAGLQAFYLGWGNYCIPEPSAMGLGLLGAALLLLARRRRG